jgi:hypothetical protein
MPGRQGVCMGKGGGKGSGQGKTGGNRGAGGPGGNCICPNCGEKSPHQQGVPCYSLVCSKCGAKMTRGL